MASEDMGLVQAQQRLDNGLNHPQLVFQDTFSCGPPPQRRPAAVSSVSDPAAAKVTTRELTGGFIDHHQHHHYFHQPTTSDFHRAIFSSSAAAAGDHPRRDGSIHNWNTSSRASTTPSGGSEDDDDDDDDDDEDDDDDNEVERLVGVDNNNSNTVNSKDKANSNSNNNNISQKIGNRKTKQLSSFCLKERNVVGQRGGNNSNTSDMRNAVTIADADGEMYYSQYLQGTTEVGSNSGQKEMAIENGCGFSGRKDNVYSNESGESLRGILSDPLTGALMDDGMILPCGHSFGSGGIQHCLRMKACCTCSHAVSEDAVSPNLSLRAAVEAYRREEELQVNRASKRRRERYEQDKGTYGDSLPPDHPRGRGVQFPFVVTDRVIIKGNKRTPPRFVGREAIVTTQCLNGWYVVKTLDNAESVKLQYRSLAKVSDNQSPKRITTIPNWL